MIAVINRLLGRTHVSELSVRPRAYSKIRPRMTTSPETPESIRSFMGTRGAESVSQELSDA